MACVQSQQFEKDSSSLQQQILTTELGNADNPRLRLYFSTHWPHVLALLTCRRFRGEGSWLPDAGCKDWGVCVRRAVLDVIPLEALTQLDSSCTIAQVQVTS